MSNTESQYITLTEASAMTKNYRTNTVPAPTGLIIAQYFGKEAIQGILDQDGCVGIRIYYAQDTTGLPQLVITGVDSAMNDLYNGLLADRAKSCPVCCSVSNPLNS